MIKKFQLVVNFMYNIKCHSFPQTLSHALNILRNFTLKSCLICISPYFMWSFLMIFFLNLEAKSIDSVLSSPEWILSILSTKQSHILVISTFNYFSISLISLCWEIRHESSAYRKSDIWQLVTYHWDILEIRLVPK